MLIKRNNNSNYNVTLSNLELLTRNEVLKLNTLKNYFELHTDKKNLNILELSNDEIKAALIGDEVLKLNLDLNQSLSLVKKESIYNKMLIDLRQIKEVKDRNYNISIYKLISFKKGLYSVDYKLLEDTSKDVTYFKITDKKDLQIYNELASATDTLLKYYENKKGALFTALGKTLDADLKPTYSTLKFLK